jgi:RHS repeat-associated protein
VGSFSFLRAFFLFLPQEKEKSGVDIDSGLSYISYKPYGEVNRTNSSGPDIYRYKYTSQEDDPDLGLYYYKARYYDPAIAKFTQADSVIDISTAEGMNQYMYVNGNPIKWRDPSGHKLKPPVAWAAAGFLYAQSQGLSFETSVRYAAVGYGIGHHKQQDEKKRNSMWGQFHRSDFGQLNTLRTEKFLGDHIFGAKLARWTTRYFDTWNGRTYLNNTGKGRLMNIIPTWALAGCIGLPNKKDCLMIGVLAALIQEREIKSYEDTDIFKSSYNGHIINVDDYSCKEDYEAGAASDYKSNLDHSSTTSTSAPDYHGPWLDNFTIPLGATTLAVAKCSSGNGQ